MEITTVAQYRIGRDPASIRRYVLEVADPDVILRGLAESAVRRIVGRSRLDDLLAGGRREAERAIAAELADAAQSRRLGVEILDVAFRDVHPPLAVLDAYRDASRAGADRAARINAGLAYRATAIGDADGRVAALKARGESERTRRIAASSGEADAFRARSEARTSHPDITDMRSYHATIEAGFAGRPKVILDATGSASARRHLLLPDSPARDPIPAAIDLPTEGESLEPSRLLGPLIDPDSKTATSALRSAPPPQPSPAGGEGVHSSGTIGSGRAGRFSTNPNHEARP